MTTLRQIAANRRNAKLSTGPVTPEGKSRSRRNAVRHGLAAETVINTLEDAEDYAAFEMAVSSDFDAQSAVERELVLRLASLLWRLRRATLIEAGLFNIQAGQRPRDRNDGKKRQRVIDCMYRNVVADDEKNRTDRGDSDDKSTNDDGPTTVVDAAYPPSDFAKSFLQINKMPAAPLDRLSRYEAALWRQACQVLWTLRCLTAASHGNRRGLPPTIFRPTEPGSSHRVPNQDGARIHRSARPNSVHP
jgi:hypothetical protein